METLDGRVALVTGASRGIGAAVAAALAGAGVRLGLASRSGDTLGITDSIAMPCDVRALEALQAIATATAERFGRLEEIIDVNVKGALYSLRVALPYLLRSDGADIVTIASEARRRGLLYAAAYCASYSASKFAQVDSPGLWITSSASAASAAPTSAPAVSPRTSRWAAAGRRRCRSSPG
jgi:3-oxoacyl-[acyl-carrier protein] reductase